MKPESLTRLCALVFASLLILSPAFGKPPATPPDNSAKKATPAPATPATPTPGASATPAPAAQPPPAENSPAFALAHWLMQAPSGNDAILLPFAQVFSAATGKHALPFDPANAEDKAALAKIGAALDAILPVLNRPDSPARNASSIGGLKEVAARFNDELRAKLQGHQDLASLSGDAYPALSFSEPTGGKVYYLGAILYQTGADPAPPALTFDPAITGVTADGSFLLIAIEHNGKTGHDLNFLNWRALDVSKFKVHFTPVFQADGRSLLQSGLILTDGRKGRD